MSHKIFYSWQDVLPSRDNRNFIEGALKDAIKNVKKDYEVESSEREGIEFDKDTTGVPGEPSITEEIFRKIDECSIFVADITAIANPHKHAILPNPNVLIEYGRATRSIGPARIIKVLNSHYGHPDEFALPFNMRHRRWPIMYSLGPGATASKRKDEKRELIQKLEGAIKSILDDGLIKDGAHTNFVHSRIQSTYANSTFLAKNENIGWLDGFDDPPPLIPRDDCHLYLRVIPINETREISKKTAIQKMISNFDLRPFSSANNRRLRGLDTGRNEHGAFIVDHIEPNVYGVTQVFKNNEIWGIDYDFIPQFPYVKTGDPMANTISYEYLKHNFIVTLESYLKFYGSELKIQPPVSIIAGVNGLRNLRLEAKGTRYSRPFQVDFIEKEIQVSDYSEGAATILRPFLEEILDECGLEFGFVES